MRQFFFYLSFALLISGTLSCGKGKPSITSDDDIYQCWEWQIHIQPYEDFPHDKAQELAEQLEIAMIGVHGWTNVYVLPNKPLTKDMLNDAKTRYRANKILDWQRDSVDQTDFAIIGLTSEDISTTLHGYDDWGILGLSYVGTGNSVVSTFRIKDNSQIYKVLLHEFGHGFMGLQHCPNNDPTCYMVDDNGKPKLDKQYHFCDSCSKLIPH